MRPALDLLAQVPGKLPSGDVVDLGCGAGAVGAALAERYPRHRRIGLDASPAMLAEARASGLYDAVEEADIGHWQPGAAPALIFSNAALNWVAGHDRLLPRLAGLIAPGGVLAVQVPDQQAAPSHQLLREISTALFPDRFDWTNWTPEVLPAERVDTLLAPLGALTLWRTIYYQKLPPQTAAHPVRAFTESTAARPILARLEPAEREAFLAAYDARLGAAYPAGPDGAVLFPFARLFFVLHRPG
ncbi:MAG: methyltransferase domain-containing protein [Rhodobacteraceae bacterium]|nr:methyltransferase domain-containing protein [Paracoccaceae bacterium]